MRNTSDNRVTIGDKSYWIDRKYYMKEFTLSNTGKKLLREYAKLAKMPMFEVVDALNSLQNKGLIVRLTKGKIYISSVIK